MKRPSSTTLLIGSLFVLMVILGYNYIARPFDRFQPTTELGAAIENQQTATSSAVQLDRRWNLEALTLEQKVGQLLVVPYELTAESASDSDKLQSWLALEPGGFIIFGSDISMVQAKAFAQLVDQLTMTDTPRVFLSTDHEGGAVQRYNGNGFTQLSTARQFCESSDAEQLTELSQSALELKQAGVSIVYGPMIDVASKSAVWKDRICSGDPSVVGAYGDNYVEAFLSQGVLPVLKHYPGLGSAERDLHSSFDQQTILAKDVEPFRSILATQPQIGVMVSHIGVLNQLPLIPCSLSADCIGQLTGTHPTVLVVSDALTMKAAAFNGETGQYDRSLENIVMSALYAGNQLLLFDVEVTPEQMAEIKAAVVLEAENNQQLLENITSAANRILDLKEFQLFQTEPSE